MQAKRTSGYTISDDLRHIIASTLIEPQETAVVSQICTEWKKEFDCKFFWKETAQKISQILLVPEHIIVPEDNEDTLTVEAYKERIRRNAGLVKNEIETILVASFPSVQMPKDKTMLDPAFFTPYTEHIKKKMLPEVLQSTIIDQHVEFEKFMKGERLHPKIFMLFIEQHILNKALIYIYNQKIQELVSKAENQKILDWLKTAKHCKNANSNNNHVNIFEVFYLFTCIGAATYIKLYSKNTLQQHGLVKNDTAFTYFLQFLDEEIYDPLFFTKVHALQPVLDTIGFRLINQEALNTETKAIIEKYKAQQL